MHRPLARQCILGSCSLIEILQLNYLTEIAQAQDALTWKHYRLSTMATAEDLMFLEQHLQALPVVLPGPSLHGTLQAVESIGR